MRSKLFVPGIREELFAKALAGPADAVSIDLEDAVPDTRKDEARAAVGRVVRSTQAQGSGKLLIVRVNPLGSPHFEADLRAISAPALDLVNLPKAEGAADVLAAVQAMDAAGLPAQVRLLVNIETPAALRRAAEIAAAHERVAGLQLGLGDLFEPAGIDRRHAANVHAAMFLLSLAAAEAGVYCCDGAFADLKDEAGFRAEAGMARSLGFIGKSCIHPSQVAWANEIFEPDAGEIERARRIVAAAAGAEALGQAAFVVDGQMIDPPFLLRARRLLQAARRK